jgi:hypothetical protein
VTPRQRAKDENEVSATSAGRWVLATTGVVTGLLLYTALQDGEWRGMIVSEVQVLAVGIATYWGLAR